VPPRQTQPNENDNDGGYLRIYVYLSNERLGPEGSLGKPNGVRSRQYIFGFLEGVVHFR